jgi:hypothetical protein
VVEDKYKLLKPILSRFCEIYVSEPILDNESINLYTYNLNETFKLSTIKTQRMDWLKKEIQKIIQKEKKFTQDDLLVTSIKFYEKAYSSIDLIFLLENSTIFKKILTDDKRYELLFAFHKIKREFRNEKILIMFIINFIFFNIDLNLENMSFI